MSGGSVSVSVHEGGSVSVSVYEWGISLTSKSLRKEPIRGSAKRKAGVQYHTNIRDPSHASGATGRSISAVRALLLGRAAMSGAPPPPRIYLASDHN